jgi:hypothetical protein
MKKTLFIILLSIAGLFAQTNYPTIKRPAFDGRGVIISDSLYQAWIDTSATPDDTLSAVTSKTIYLGAEYDWGLIALTDTGDVYVDSVMIEMGVITADGDIIWDGINLRGTDWTDVPGLAVGNDASTIYTTFFPLGAIIRIRLINEVTVYGRVHYFDINLIKKKQEN